MPELRPTCEHCNKKLLPDSLEAMICSFDCTLCKACAQSLFVNVCPICGGGFCSRPVRPDRNWKGDNFLGKYPASATEKHRLVDLDAQRELAAKIGSLSPASDETRDLPCFHPILLNFRTMR
jgi:hypothetical protein